MRAELEWKRKPALVVASSLLKLVFVFAGCALLQNRPLPWRPSPPPLAAMGNCASTSSSTRTEEVHAGTGPSQTGTTTAAVSQTGAVPSNNKSLNKSTSGGRQKSSERAAGGRTGSPAPTGAGVSRSGGPHTDPDSDNGTGATSGGGKHSPHLGPSKDRPPPTPILSSAKPKGAAKKDRVLANKYVAETHHTRHTSHGSSGGGLAVQVEGNTSGGEGLIASPASSPEHVPHRRPSIGGAGGNSGSALGSGAPLGLEVSAPLEGDAVSGHFLRVASSPKHASSSPKHGRHQSQGSRNERRRSRRSSEGRRLLAEAQQADQDKSGAAGGADAIRTPPFTSAPRRLTGNRDAAATPPLNPTGSARRQQSNPRRRSGQHGTTRRRTSNNGMMSRLALQFPMVRTSFLAVYRAFEKYMQYVRRAEEMVEKRRSLRAGSMLLSANTMLQLRVADESKLQDQAPLSKQSTESRIGAGQPSASQQSRAPHTGQVAHNPTASSTGADLQMDQLQPERSELGALVKAADHAASANALDRELDALSEEDLRKREIAALLAASPLPLLDVGAAEAQATTTASAAANSAAATSPTGASRGSAASSAASAAAASSSSSTAATPAAAASSTDDAAATGLVIKTIPPVPTVSANRVAALGTLTVDRLGDALQAVTGSEHPLPDAELSAIFSSADLDHSGGISFREFLVAVALGCFLKEDLERDRRAKEMEKIAATTGRASPGPVALNRMVSRPSPRTGPGQSAVAIAAGVPSPRRLDLHTDAPASSSPGHASNPSVGGQLSPKLGAQEQSAPPVVQINNLTGSPALGTPSAAASSNPNSPAATAVGSGAGASGNRRPSLLSHVSMGSISTLRTPSSSHFAEVARGFRVVYAAFREMDADRSESVERAELKRALFSAAPMKSDSALLESRFRELDFDDSGEINLAEFLYGVVSWVGLMEEDEELEQRV